MRHRSRLHVLLASCFLTAAPLSASAQVVISQAYGGGGNSGATFTHDFVELFNRGQTPVALGGKSIQYASSAGSFTNVAPLPSVTVQPGQYFLVQLAAGSGNGVALPAADATGGLNLSGTAGKVALVEGTTALGCGTSAAPCAADKLALMLDLVGFGGANLAEGSPTAALSNSTAALRKGAGCTDTDNNSADFEVLTPVPRNTATATNLCAGGSDPTDPSATGSASPSVVAVGGSTLLTVQVTPGTNPASTGLAVTGDLSAIGGSATQAFVDDGTGGDATAGDNIFSFQATVGAGTPAGAVVLPVAVADAQSRAGQASINLSVAGTFSISQIQGAGIGSPLPAGTNVVTEGIVTALRSNGYFIQSAPGDEDADPATPEGIYVFTNTAPPAQAVVGNRVRVSARVSSFFRTPHGYPLPQLNWATAEVLSTGNPLPPVVEIDPALLQPASPLSGLGRYQGMRVQLPQAKVVGPTKNGAFFVTLPQTPRPAREPGIAALDVVPLPPGNNIPVFDKNPERLRVEGRGLADAPASDLFVDAGVELQGLAGVMYYEEGDFTVLMGDRGGLVESGGADIGALPLPADGAVRIASFNIENLNGGAGTSLVRLEKLSEVFCQVLRLPDIVGLVEIANLETAQRLAEVINTNEFGDCPDNPQYQAYLLSTSGSQRLAYLVFRAPVRAGQARVVVDSVTQQFVADLLVKPDNSNDAVLFDRPPLYLRATVHAANGETFPVHVVLNHTLSLLDVNDIGTRTDSWGTQGARSRGKRLQQAIKVSQLVESIQAANPDDPLVLIGDYNAFDFNDGYVDVMGIIAGTPAPADQVLAYGASAVTRPLVNLITTKPEAQRYS